MDGGRYRLDIQVGPRVFVEVDGFAYHWAPSRSATTTSGATSCACSATKSWSTTGRPSWTSQRRVVKEIKTAVREQVPAGHRTHRPKRTKALPARPPRPVTASGSGLSADLSARFERQISADLSVRLLRTDRYTHTCPKQNWELGIGARMAASTARPHRNARSAFGLRRR